MNYILLPTYFSDEVNGRSVKIRDFPVHTVNSQDGFLKDTLPPYRKSSAGRKSDEAFYILDFQILWLLDSLSSQGSKILSCTCRIDSFLMLRSMCRRRRRTEFSEGNPPLDESVSFTML